MEQCTDVNKNIFDTKYEMQPVLTPHSLTVGPYAVVRVHLSSLKPAVVIVKNGTPLLSGRFLYDVNSYSEEM